MKKQTSLLLTILGSHLSYFADDLWSNEFIAMPADPPRKKKNKVAKKKKRKIETKKSKEGVPLRSIPMSPGYPGESGK